MNWLSAAVRRYPIVAITLVVGIVGIGIALGGHPEVSGWIISVYALAVAAIQTVGMVKDVLRGHWGIDLLAVTAIVATVLVGEFWASLVIVLMLSGGEALEDYAGNRAKRELSALLARSPQTAHRLVGSDAVDVPVTEVLIGDLLLVKPSEIVPVDGELVTDEATFDESSLTGESLPVDRVAGDGLLSGAVNGDRAITMRATALAEDSQYQRIVALVSEAAASRAPLVRLADRYAVPFTLVSFAIAGFAWWMAGDPVRFAEVLVVATPCPLLIAAPVAFMGGMSRASRIGVIVKNGGTLEQLSRVKTAAFDKTGTLTEGAPTVESIHPEPGFTDDELLQLAASAEQYSTHVLAKSVVDAALARSLSLITTDTASEYATNGVTATLSGRQTVVGKRAFVEQHSAAESVPEPDMLGGQQAVYVSVDGVFAGTLLLRDQLRHNSAQTLRALASLGVQDTLMLTGDARHTAEHMGQELGLTDVRADLLPMDKVTAVEAISARPVMMIGDGVNDAPVLTAADIGVAMGAKGSTAASDSADVVIMTDDISRVVDAVLIGQRTMRVATQSIWLGIGLSVGLMLVATFGWLPAIVGATLQEVIDLATILNSLRALTAGRAARRAAPAQRVEKVPVTMH
ncbi:heavy metal translocating P-type ATPase [Homoserinimonas sp. OAct 916]|uniref:heavy metal translocating P-type ATPase n=1 Tax=Homoserinimonas sp. OAct 916 TaxID=2211450 RepID=UPI000DBE5B7F|nr:heavy metal translocating P-type ATPase [Homoserinimonas sp. OAct 916]